jgi:Ca-activated chloride channel family protein
VSKRGAPKKPVKRQSSFATSKWLPRLTILLIVLAVGSLAAALAQFKLTKTKAEDAPIVMLVMDASMTMSRTDIAPNRLAAAQSAARTFLEQLPANFRVGLVTFAIEPAVLAEPTTDHEQVLAALDSPPRGNRTVMGEGLAASLDTIESLWSEAGRTDSAVILLSDGLDTPQDQIDPLEAAARARSLELPVHTVILGLTGTAGGANEELMSQIANTTGGSVSTASTAGELTDVYQTLGSKLSTQLKIGSTAQVYVPLAVLFSIGAAVLVLMSFSRQKF